MNIRKKILSLMVIIALLATSYGIVYASDVEPEIAATDSDLTMPEQELNVEEPVAEEPAEPVIYENTADIAPDAQKEAASTGYVYLPADGGVIPVYADAGLEEIACELSRETASIIYVDSVAGKAMHVLFADNEGVAQSGYVACFEFTPLTPDEASDVSALFGMACIKNAGMFVYYTATIKEEAPDIQPDEDVLDVGAPVDPDKDDGAPAANEPDLQEPMEQVQDVPDKASPAIDEKPEDVIPEVPADKEEPVEPVQHDEDVQVAVPVEDPAEPAMTEPVADEPAEDLAEPVNDEPEEEPQPEESAVEPIEITEGVNEIDEINPDVPDYDIEKGCFIALPAEKILYDARGINKCCVLSETCVMMVEDIRTINDEACYLVQFWSDVCGKYRVFAEGIVYADDAECTFEEDFTLLNKQKAL